jgi:hypothetical protein
MQKLLKDPKKRRQLLIAGSAVVVLIVLLVLHKKSTPAATTTEESAAKPTTEPPNLPAGESGGSGGGSTGTGTGTNNPPAGGGVANGEGATIAGAIQSSAAEAAASQLETQQDLAALANALSRSSEPGPSPSGPAPQASHAGATPLKGLTKNAEPGNPRAGDAYVTKTEHGKPLHEYLTPAGKPKAVPGGVGKYKNKVFLPTKATPKRTPAPAIKNATAGNPRKGETYKETTYRGKKAHEYKTSVPHGVGPKHNLIIL